MKQVSQNPVFRFAPSPNGRLHLGHAYSALLNRKMADETAGRFLLRIEDTDTIRCTPALEKLMLEDLEWLGVTWDEEPRRQSDHVQTYLEAISTLEDEGLVYPAFMSRSEVRAHIEVQTAKGTSWPVDPDGSPLYPEIDRKMPTRERQNLLAEGVPHSLRLDMKAAIEHVAKDLSWQENGSGPEGETGEISANPRAWGDIVLSRKDIAASYHVAVVVDDAIQGITHIVRGRDLFWSTSVHRLLQTLLGLPEPLYFHHDLVLDDDGTKLSKSRNDTSLAELRAAGATPSDIRKMVGLIW